MGKPILYCSDCGVSLREEDFDRGRAGHHLHRPYCTTCRPDLKPVTPRSVPRPPAERPLSPASTRSRLPQARPASRAVPLAVAALAGGLLMIALFASLSPAKRPVATNQPGSFVASPSQVTKAPESRPAEPRPKPEPPPPVAPAPSLDRWLDEIRAIRKDDPHFRRAGEVRSMLRKAVEIAGPRRAEVDSLLAAYEAELAKPAPPPPVAPAPSLDRWLDEIRAIRKDDPDFRRAGEVRSMFRKAVEIAGPRRAEVDSLLAAYEAELAKPAPPPAPEPPKPAVAFTYTLINAETGKPVPGFDPMPAEAVVDLGRLGLKRIDVRINTPRVLPSLELQVNENPSRCENTPPYACTLNNSQGKFEGWIPVPGRQTIKIRTWTQKNGKGTADPWTSFSFTIVDPR